MNRFYMSYYGLVLLHWPLAAFSFRMIPYPRQVALPVNTIRKNHQPLYAIGVLARKAKEMDVRQYVEGGIEPNVLSRIQQLDTFLAHHNKPNEPTPISTMGPLQQALTKRKGTLTLIAEYKRNFQSDTSSFASGEIMEPILISPVFREFGAAAIAVTADSRSGGATYPDMLTFAQEQATAQGNVPGPLLIINNDLIVDPVQLCRGAAYGAHAAVVHINVVGLDKAKYLYQCCTHGLGMECILAVTTLEQAQAAIQQVGGSLLYIVGQETQDKIQILQDLSPTLVAVSRPICIIADILANDNKGLEEVEEAWLCRDKGFQAVWVSDALYKAGNDPTEHCGAIIKSMKAKSSVKWASAKARSGKGEGAREYLGDIMM